MADVKKDMLLYFTTLCKEVVVGEVAGRLLADVGAPELLMVVLLISAVERWIAEP